MSKKSGEMLAEIKHGIETGEDKNGIKVDGLAYTWKQLEPLYQYIQTIQNEYKTLQKRNSRQRLANQKQQELILKLQQENERIKQENENLKCIISSVKEDYLTEHNELEDYKSRCEKVSDFINKHIYIPSYDEDLSFEKVLSLVDDDLDNLLNILQNGSDDNEKVNL